MNATKSFKYIVVIAAIITAALFVNPCIRPNVIQAEDNNKTKVSMMLGVMYRYQDFYVTDSTPLSRYYVYTGCYGDGNYIITVISNDFAFDVLVPRHGTVYIEGTPYKLTPIFNGIQLERVR